MEGLCILISTPQIFFGPKEDKKYRVELKIYNSKYDDETP